MDIAKEVFPGPSIQNKNNADDVIMIARQGIQSLAQTTQRHLDSLDTV